MLEDCCSLRHGTMLLLSNKFVYTDKGIINHARKVRLSPFNGSWLLMAVTQF